MIAPHQREAEARRLAAEHGEDWIVCNECGGTGTAEIIDGWSRPCDNCGGEGGWSATDQELGLLPDNELSEDEALFLSRSWDVPLSPQPPTASDLNLAAEF